MGNKLLGDPTYTKVLRVLVERFMGGVWRAEVEIEKGGELFSGQATTPGAAARRAVNNAYKVERRTNTHSPHRVEDAPSNVSSESTRVIFSYPNGMHFEFPSGTTHMMLSGLNGKKRPCCVTRGPKPDDTAQEGERMIAVQFTDDNLAHTSREKFVMPIKAWCDLQVENAQERARRPDEIRFTPDLESELDEMLRGPKGIQ